MRTGRDLARGYLLHCAARRIIGGNRLALNAPRCGLKWKRLPSLPDAEGFAAPFVGVSRDVLLVAGGANFPAKRPWEGGAKVWHDRMFALESPDGVWREVGKLPEPVAHGVSYTTGEGVVCAGGGNETPPSLSLTREDALRIAENLENSLSILQRAQARGKTSMDVYFASVLSTLRRDILGHVYSREGDLWSDAARGKSAPVFGT